MDDKELIRRFEAQAISRAEWTHQAHVKVAYLYLKEWPLEEAVEKIKAGIQKLNAANGVEEGPDRGYSETTTVAFTHLIAAVMGAYGGVIACASAEEFCDKHPQLMTAHVLRLFYSPARMRDPGGKFRFLEPDLAALPRIRSGI